MTSGILGRMLLDQYRVDRFIASGGMATVYRVYDLKRNVPLAMKVLQEDLAEDPSILKRFRREAEALTSLAHPHIVTFYGLFQEGNISFLLERFIDGPTLKDILKIRQGRPIPLRETAIYIKAICSALGYAHANGLVHCDIKPGNVMVDHGGVVYLADFGIARYADTITTTIASAGTPAYMAPEQIQGTTVSPATDIYALGVMLFEMLTGRRPFTGNEPGLESTGATTGERVRYAHLKLQPPDPGSINPALSPALANMILQAMTKDPAKRFASTQALFTALCAAGEVAPGEVADRLDLAEVAQVEAGQDGGTAAPPADVAQSTGSKVPDWTNLADAQRGKKRLPTWIWLGGGGCILAIVALVVIVALVLSGGIPLFPANPTAVSAGQEPSPIPQTVIPLAAVPTQTPAAAPSENSLAATPTPVVFAPTNTKTVKPSATKPPDAATCPGAKPQRVKVGEKAIICTKQDRLILRKDPILSSPELRRIPTGTEFTITNGPSCADTSSWWLIKIEDGTTGWVREGSDEVDPYFICPIGNK